MKYFKNFTMFYSGFTLTRLTFFIRQTLPLIYLCILQLPKPICRPTCLVCFNLLVKVISHHRYRNILPDFTNKVSKPVKGNYLLLCMNSIMYLLLTWYTLIMFLKVLSPLIMKIKSFMKYFKKGVLKYFKICMKFLNISKWNISSCISTCI